jgi:hypothetical protein
VNKKMGLTVESAKRGRRARLFAKEVTSGSARLLPRRAFLLPAPSASLSAATPPPVRQLEAQVITVLLLQNEYLAAENRILKAKLSMKLRLSDPERAALAEIGKRMGRKLLAEVACVARAVTRRLAGFHDVLHIDNSIVMR